VAEKQREGTGPRNMDGRGRRWEGEKKEDGGEEKTG